MPPKPMLNRSSILIPKPPAPPPNPPPIFIPWGSSEPVMSYILLLSGSFSNSQALTTFSNFYFARGSYLFRSGWYFLDLLLKAFLIWSSVASLEMPNTLQGFGVLETARTTQTIRRMITLLIMFMLDVVKLYKLIEHIEFIYHRNHNITSFRSKEKFAPEFDKACVLQVMSRCLLLAPSLVVCFPTRTQLCSAAGGSASMCCDFSMSAPASFNYLMINYSSNMSQISETKKGESILSLCRLRKDCHYPPVSVDFSPILRPSRTYEAILPTFNQDRLFYTPSFINPYQRSLAKLASDSSRDHEREKFLKKVEANLSQPEENKPVFNPKDDLFCSICAMAFRDYWQHIGSSAHHRKLKASRGDQYIQEICKPVHQWEGSRKSPHSAKRLDELAKTKKIQKREIRKKGSRKNKRAGNQDLIVKLPMDLFEREERAQCLNLSTNGATSLDQKP